MENFDKIKEDSKWVQFPRNGRYVDYGDYINSITLKFPVIENSTYSNWKRNEHHFTTKYHFTTVLPMLSQVLGFEYDAKDFYMLQRCYEDFDISMIAPNKGHLYDVINYIDGEKLTNVGYMSLVYSGSGLCDQNTEYHKLYRYGHQCSMILNKTVDNERKLLISCDSQMIPSIPILSCYFRQIVILDNRINKCIFEDIKDIEFTDVLFAIGYEGLEKYVRRNLL